MWFWKLEILDKLEKKERAQLVIFLILIVALSFALGYIFAGRFFNTPIIIQKIGD